MSCEKQKIRAHYLSLRKKLSEQEIQNFSEHIVDVFVKEYKELIGAQCIHVFIPIEKQKEINTWSMIQYFWKKGLMTCTSIPCREEGVNNLQHVVFDRHTTWCTGLWGVPVPRHPNYLQDISMIDMVITPLLTFDTQGHRLGYGKAFYDTFLACVQAVKVGLSYFPPVESLPVDAHDIALDYVITPQKMYCFPLSS